MGVASSAPLSVGCDREGVVRVAVKERYHPYLQDTNLNAELTEEKVKLVHEHWNSIANEDWHESRPSSQQSRISLFYDAYYERLFELAPETRKQFEGNMVRQSRALVKMVSWLCNLEVNTETDLVTKLEALADRHFHYGCKPSHYKAGGDALLHALRVASKNYGIAPKVMSAWEDLYSFVLLIIIPRTALLLEEEERAAGPVHLAKRGVPIVANRRRSSSRAYDPAGDDCSDSCARSDRMSATSDGEWVSNTACLSEGHVPRGSSPMVRTGSSSFPRGVVNGGGRRRNAPQKSLAGRRLLHDLKSSMNAVGGGRPGELHGTIATVTRCPMGFSDTDVVLTPGDSPASIASSVASVRQSSVRSNPNLEKGDFAAPGSPHDSATSSRAKSRGEGRTSKLLRGLGKLTGTGGAAPLSNHGSPRGSLRSRARLAVVRHRHDGVCDDGNDSRSKRRDKAGAAAPHLPLSSRRAQLRSASEPPEIVGGKQREVSIVKSNTSPGDDFSEADESLALVSSVASDRDDCPGIRAGGFTRSVSARGRDADLDDTGCTALPSPGRASAPLPNFVSWKSPSAAIEGTTSGSADLTGRSSTVAPTTGGGLSCISRTPAAVAPSEEECISDMMLTSKTNYALSGGERKAFEGRGNGARDLCPGDPNRGKGTGRSLVGGEPSSDEVMAVRLRATGVGGMGGGGDFTEEMGRSTEVAPGTKATKDHWWSAPSHAALRAEISPREELVRPEPLQLPESSTNNVESISFSRNGWTGTVAHSRRVSSAPDSLGKWSNSISSCSSCSSSTRLTPGRLWGRDDAFSRRGFSRRSKERIGPDVGAVMVPFEEDAPTTLARLGQSDKSGRPSSLPMEARHGSRRNGRHATRHCPPLRSANEECEDPKPMSAGKKGTDAEDPHNKRQSSRPLRRYGSTGNDPCRGRSFRRFSDFNGNRNRDQAGDSELGARVFPGYRRSSSGVFDRTRTSPRREHETYEGAGAAPRETQHPRRHSRAKSWRPYRRRASDVTDTHELLLPASERAGAKLEVGGKQRQKHAGMYERDGEYHARGVAVTCSRQSVDISGKSFREAEEPRQSEPTGGSSAQTGLGSIFHTLNLWSSTASLTPTPSRASPGMQEEERPNESERSPPTPTASVTPRHVDGGLHALAPTSWPFGTSSTSVTEPVTVTPTSPIQRGKVAELGDEGGDDVPENARVFVKASSEASLGDRCDLPADERNEMPTCPSVPPHISIAVNGRPPLLGPCDSLGSDRSVVVRDSDGLVSTFDSTSSGGGDCLVLNHQTQSEASGDLLSSVSHSAKTMPPAVDGAEAVMDATLPERSLPDIDRTGLSNVRVRAATVDMGSVFDGDGGHRNCGCAGSRGLEIECLGPTKAAHCGRSGSTSSPDPVRPRQHSADATPLQSSGPELEVPNPDADSLCQASSYLRSEPCVEWSDNRPMALPPTEDGGDQPEADRFGNGSPASRNGSGFRARSQDGRDAGRGSGKIKRNNAKKRKPYCGTPYRQDAVDVSKGDTGRKNWNGVLHPVRAIRSLPRSSLNSRQNIVLSDSDLEHSKSEGEDDYRNELTDDEFDSDFDEPETRRQAVEQRSRAMTEGSIPTWQESTPESVTDSSSPSGETESRISGPICRHLVEVEASDEDDLDVKRESAGTPPRDEDTNDPGGKGIAGAVEMWTGGVLRREESTAPSTLASSTESATAKLTQCTGSEMNPVKILADGGIPTTSVDVDQAPAAEGRSTNPAASRASGTPDGLILGDLADSRESDVKQYPMVRSAGRKSEPSLTSDPGRGRRSGETRKAGSGPVGPSSSRVNVSVSRPESARAADRASRENTCSPMDIIRNLKVREALERFHGDGAVDPKGSEVYKTPIEGLPYGTVRAKANSWGNMVRSS